MFVCVCWYFYAWELMYFHFNTALYITVIRIDWSLFCLIPLPGRVELGAMVIKG